MARSDRPGNIAHVLNPENAGNVIPPGFDLRHRSKEGDASRRACSFVAPAGNAVELRPYGGEEAPKQTLAAEQFGREVADMACVDVARLEPGVIGTIRICDGQWCEMDFAGHRGWLSQTQIWGAYPGETYKD